MPLRLDDCRLLGLPDTVMYLDLRTRSVSEAAEILMDKLEAIRGRVAYGPSYHAWIATFGAQINEVKESAELPPDAPNSIPELYDWLEKDLLARCTKAGIDNPRLTDPSQRTGETLSIRIAFERVIIEEPLTFGELDWWHLLEFHEK